MIFGTSAKGETVTKHSIAAGDLSVTFLSWGAAVYEVRALPAPVLMA